MTSFTSNAPKWYSLPFKVVTSQQKTPKESKIPYSTYLYLHDNEHGHSLDETKKWLLDVVHLEVPALLALTCGSVIKQFNKFNANQRNEGGILLWSWRVSFLAWSRSLVRCWAAIKKFSLSQSTLLVSKIFFVQHWNIILRKLLLL